MIKFAKQLYTLVGAGDRGQTKGRAGTVPESLRLEEPSGTIKSNLGPVPTFSPAQSTESTPSLKIKMTPAIRAPGANLSPGSFSGGFCSPTFLPLQSRGEISTLIPSF